MQAEFDIQREVFEQNLFDAGLSPLYGNEASSPSPDPLAGFAVTLGTDIAAADANIAEANPMAGATEDQTGKPRRRTAPYKHALRFEDLVYPPVHAANIFVFLYLCLCFYSPNMLLFCS